MFRKKLNSISSLHNELKARKYLSSEYTPPINRVDVSNNTVFFENNGYVNLEQFINNYSQQAFIDIILYRIVFNLIDAINNLNLNGIIHLDLKPSNILIDNKANVKIIDFENFLKVDQNHGPLPKAEGNFLYRAPERDTSNYGIESNIFSLGLLVYYIIHGSHPYFELSQAEIIEWKNTWKIEYSPIIHPLVKYFIENCINPNPKDRFVLNLGDHFKYSCFVLNLGDHFKYSCFVRYNDADELHAFALMYSEVGRQYIMRSIAYDVFSEVLNFIDVCSYSPIIIFPLTFNEIFLETIEPFTKCDNIPLDDFLCEFTILESIFESSRVALDKYEEYNFLSRLCGPSETFYFFDSTLYGFERFYNFTGPIFCYRSYQEILGTDVALDMIEGTYHLLTDSDIFSCAYFPTYIFVQPKIMAFFPDAYDLLCLDFNYFDNILFPFFRTFIFNYEALNLNDIILTLKSQNVPLEIFSILKCIGSLMKYDFYKYYAEANIKIEDCNLSFEFFEKNLRPELYNYRNVYQSFVNLMNKCEYYENLHLIPSQENDSFFRNTIRGFQINSENMKNYHV